MPRLVLISAFTLSLLLLLGPLGSNLGNASPISSTLLDGRDSAELGYRDISPDIASWLESRGPRGAAKPPTTLGSLSEENEEEEKEHQPPKVSTEKDDSAQIKELEKKVAELKKKLGKGTQVKGAAKAPSGLDSIAEAEEPQQNAPGENNAAKVEKLKAEAAVLEKQVQQLGTGQSQKKLIITLQARS
ncbi:hypothetical protein BT96DRAFT_917079, partial [Gymnopus androsaceus JB14]